MADRDQNASSGGRQVQRSQQSAQKGAAQQGSARQNSNQQAQSGIGASQRQDRSSRDENQSERPSAGTADVERTPGSSHSQERGGNSEESLVQESTGAFKERP